MNTRKSTLTSSDNAAQCICIPRRRCICLLVIPGHSELQLSILLPINVLIIINDNK